MHLMQNEDSLLQKEVLVDVQIISNQHLLMHTTPEAKNQWPPSSHEILDS